MGASTNSATDEQGATASLSPSGSAYSASEIKESPRAFIRGLQRDFTEDELANPVIRRILLAEIENLEKECSEYKPFMIKYYEARETIATLAEAGRVNRKTETLSTICLLTGGALFGCATKYLAVPNELATGFIVLAASVVLLVIGLLSKVVKWK